MGVCPASSVFFAMGGESSSCINDLASYRGDLQEVARPVQGNYRGATSAEGGGVTLNFERPGAFIGRLRERRWAPATTLLGQGAMAVRELARRAGHDVRRVHEGVQVLTGLGLVERDHAGGV
jgi:predicted transcriptional regulator